MSSLFRRSSRRPFAFPARFVGSIRAVVGDADHRVLLENVISDAGVDRRFRFRDAVRGPLRQRQLSR
jgi:hypothetical protein